MHNFDPKVLELVEEEIEKVAAGKMDVKTGATKVLAVALSALSVTGGIGANAMQPKKEINTATRGKFNLKKGAKTAVALAVPILTLVSKFNSKKEAGDAVISGADEMQMQNGNPQKIFLHPTIYLMRKLHNVNDLFRFKVLKSSGIKSYDEDYWNQDITDELKNLGLIDGHLYENNCLDDKYFENIGKIFGDHIILNQEILQDFVSILSCYKDKEKVSEEILDLSYKSPADSLFKDDKLNMTRKNLLKVIILLISKYQKHNYYRDHTNGFGRMIFSINRDYFYPLIPAGIIDLGSSFNVHNIITKVSNSSFDPGAEECNKLCSFLPYYLAVNTLIKRRILELNSVDDFVDKNNSLLDGWLNAKTLQEYKDYLENILAEIEAYKANNG